MLSLARVANGYDSLARAERGRYNRAWTGNTDVGGDA